MEYLSLSPVIGLSIVGLGQVVITITEVLVVLMKEIINHHITEFIMIREVHTALIIEVIEIQITEIPGNRDSRGDNSPDYRSSKNEDSRDYDSYKSDSYRSRSRSPTSLHKP